MTGEFFDAYLGLGANLGDRRTTLDWAVERLGGLPGTELAAVSSYRETAPVGGPPGQPAFLNGAVHLRTRLSAQTLFECAKALEREAGRPAEGERNGPRVLDLDVLLHGQGPVDTPALVVPHPRMRGRAFVEEPLAELGVVVSDLEQAARPEVVTDPVDLLGRCREFRNNGHRIGVVPTMGALHRGHRELMARARSECSKVITTLFVNPKQFGEGEDLERYPRTFDSDLAMCQEVGVDLLFTPAPAAMYPQGFCSEVAVGAEAEGLEDSQRPGHFEGVATVVAKLFALTEPDRSYFGQKDAQQVAVLRRLRRDLGLGGELVECPTVREPDGLALSSRNRYLDPGDRAAAPVLYRSLEASRRAFLGGSRSRSELLDLARTMVAAEPRATLDYLALRRADDLSEFDSDLLPSHGEQPARMLVAARFGAVPTRLLDNLILRP